MSYTWNDYPYGPFVTMRVFQIVLGFVVTALSGYLTGNRDYNRFIIPLFPVSSVPFQQSNIQLTALLWIAHTFCCLGDNYR